jgi:hypothetical protein
MGAIRLEPAGASISTQALLIYPTVQDGNHIHLTAGGGDTDLYLGNDDQFVKIDHSGTVVVGTYSTATASTWTFGTDGVLTLSTASTILGNSSDPNVYIETATPTTTSTWTFGTDGILTFPNTNLQIGELYGLVGMLGGTDALIGIAGQGNSGAVGLQWFDDLTSATSVASVILNNSLATSIGTVQIWTGIPAGPIASNVWEFGTDGSLTLPDGGDIKNSSGTSVLTVVTGQETYEFDGVNTTLTITNVTFNLLFCTAAVGYSGSDGHTVLLPAGTAGQRLVIVNISSLCTLTVDGAIDGAVNVAPEGTAELIYLVGAGVTGWWPLYGTTLVT